MKRVLFIFIALFLFTVSAISANAASITVSVNGQSGPWLQSANPGYYYGELLSAPNYNLPPTIINSASGLTMQVGNTLTIEYISGLVNAGGGGIWVNANGATWWPCDAGLAPYVFTDKSKPGYLEQLMGVFADPNGVIIGTPFIINNGPLDVVIPIGATQLQLGFNDGWYNDNGGSLLVKVTETPVPSPEPSSMILGLMGICGLIKVRKKSV